MLDQLRHTRSGARRDGEHLPTHLQLGGRVKRRRHRAPRQPVDLVHRHRHRRLRARERMCDETVARAHALLAVEDQQGDVRALELLVHAPRHACGELVARTLNTGQVHEDHLTVAAGMHAANSPSRGLRTVGDDRHLLPHDQVDEGRLAHVGPPGQSYEAASSHRLSRPSSACWSSSISPSSVS